MDKTIIEEANELEKGGFEPVEPIVPEVQPEVVKTGISFDFSWLKTPTGEGSIEERIDHPLNFGKSKGMAQVIRGLEGFLGNLKLAVVDVVLGILQYTKERRPSANVGNTPGVNQ